MVGRLWLQEEDLHLRSLAKEASELTPSLSCQIKRRFFAFFRGLKSALQKTLDAL